MKTISAALKAHLAQEVTTVARLWQVTRKDGVVMGFTDASTDIVYSGVTYAASTGQIPTNIATTSNLGVDNLEITSVLDSNAITESDILAGVYDMAEVVIMLVNYKDLTMGHMVLRKGWIGNISVGRNNFVAELRGMMQPLQQTIGRVYSPLCDAVLGDAKCGVTLSGYTVTGTVTSVTSARQFTDTARAEANKYFEGGLITWTSGLNTGYSMEVKLFASSVITLQQPMVRDIQVGDAYTLVAGCDKVLATCRDKFNNVVNFRGFPHVPGQDKLLSGGR